MQVEYELNKQDYIDFNLYHAKTSDAIRKALFVQRFLVPVLYLILAFLLSMITEIPLPVWAVAFLAAAVLWIVFYPAYFRKTLGRRVDKMVNEGKNKDMLGRHLLTVDETGLINKSQNGENRMGWNGVEKIVPTEKHILIYVSSISAFIIPNRTFETADSRELFLEYIMKQKNGTLS